MTSTSRLYFPGLNGLRFLAAGLVMVAHIEQMKSEEGIPNLNNTTLVGQAGQNGVTLFFVLSGFLITFLLLQEDKLTGKIDIRKFYFRRILRIWPLYYLIVLIGFFVVPYVLRDSGLENPLVTSYWPKLMLFLFFLPNLALVAYPPMPFITQTWSIGTEEQFYLIWPWILRKFKKSLPLVLGCIIVGIMLLRKTGFVLIDHLREGHARNLVSLGVHWLNTFTIECMAIGGLAAWLLFTEKKKILVLLFHPLFQVFLFSSIMLSLCTGLGGHIKFRDGVNSLLFACLILNLAGNPGSLLKLENVFFRFMGNISFGMYMYHPLCFYLVYTLFKDFLKTGSQVTGNIITYCFVFVMTTGVAWLSYTFFEKRFLKRKKVFSVIQSGTEN